MRNPKASAIDDIRKNKGSFGNAVETHYFMLDLNSDFAPDFKEAGLELKTTPLKRGKGGSLVAKERLVLGMIDYMQVVHEEFETSHLMEKANDILLISYLWEPGADPLDYLVELVELVNLSELPASDIAQIKADWEMVVDKVRAGRAHEISGSDTLYLEACTKAANSSVRRKQPYSDIEAKPRAWALKASFMTAMSNRLLEDVQPIQRLEDEAKRCYEEMRLQVVSGRAQDSVKSSENRCCHVRPHGRNANDVLPTPQGEQVVKKCFWLNAQYLKGEILRLTKQG